MPFLRVFVAALALEAQYFAASALYETPFMASAVGAFLVRFPQNSCVVNCDGYIAFR
jgi:hypothetical protein